MGAKIVSFWVVPSICRVGSRVFMRLPEEGLSDCRSRQSFINNIYSGKKMKFRGGNLK